MRACDVEEARVLLHMRRIASGLTKINLLAGGEEHGVEPDVPLHKRQSFNLNEAKKTDVAARSFARCRSIILEEIDDRLKEIGVTEF